MFGIIYKVVNKLNQKIYIGQTTHSLEQRRALHLTEAKHRPRTHFQHALRKYGAEAFYWEQIATADSREELDQLEIQYIEALEALDPTKGYNGKTGGSRGQNSAAVRQKISESVKTSEKFRAAMQDPEFRERRAKLRQGTRHSEETKRKMSEASKGNHRGLGKKKPIGFGEALSIQRKGKNNPKVFPFMVVINKKAMLWREGFPALRDFLIQNYQLSISTVGLQKLYHGEYKTSRNADKLGIQLKLLERNENEDNSRGSDSTC